MNSKGSPPNNLIPPADLSSFRIAIVKGSYICQRAACGQALGSSFALRNHDRIHRNVRPFRCNYPIISATGGNITCLYSARTKENVAKHVRDTHLKMAKKGPNKKQGNTAKPEEEYIVTDQRLLDEEDAVFAKAEAELRGKGSPARRGRGRPPGSKKKTSSTLPAGVLLKLRVEKTKREEATQNPSSKVPVKPLKLRTRSVDRSVYIEEKKVETEVDDKSSDDSEDSNDGSSDGSFDESSDGSTDDDSEDKEKAKKSKISEIFGSDEDDEEKETLTTSITRVKKNRKSRRKTKKFRCYFRQLCKASFLCKESVLLHQLGHLPTIKPYRCTFPLTVAEYTERTADNFKPPPEGSCGLATSNIASLEEHIRLVHYEKSPTIPGPSKSKGKMGPALRYLYTPYIYTDKVLVMTAATGRSSFTPEEIVSYFDNLK